MVSIAPILGLLIFFALLAFIPGKYKKQFIRGQCQQCHYARTGLDPAAPCPECGQPYLESPIVESDRWHSYGGQCLRNLSIFALCVAVVIPQQWLMHLAFALAYWVDGFSFSTSWKAAFARDIEDYNFCVPYLMVCVLPPLPLLAFLPDTRRAIKAFAIVLAFVITVSFAWVLLPF